jgi:DNA-nicking Smr family endonuclease
MGQTASNVVSTLWSFLPSAKPDTADSTSRESAFAARQLATAYSQQSRDACYAGNHSSARDFSALSKQQWQEYHRLNSLAEIKEFEFHNPTYPGDLNRIDLHGLLVKEAIVRIQRHVKLCKDAGIQRTLVITGRGIHSKEGIAKIKPAIRELCVSEGLQVIPNESNEGCLTVVIGVSEGNVGWDKCIIM